MPLTQSPFKAIFWINHPPNGYTETWHLRAGDFAQARADAITLAEARSFLLAQHCVLEFAAVQTENAPYIQWAAIDAPLAALPQWGPVDNDWTTLLWRFDTGEGKAVPRHFRSVADDEISNRRWLRAPLDIPPGPAVRPLAPALATIPDLYRYVLATIRDLTCHCVELPPDGLGRIFWEQTPWAAVWYRGVSSFNVGAQYFRGSWEPREYVEQPGFTPCGTVVCALRTFYEQACEYFSAGPSQGIRYYKAEPGAAVMPFKTIFWGWKLAKQIADGVTPGESKGLGTYGYSKGLSWGTAPALAPDGIEQQFMGLSVCPWGLSPTTPGIYIVGCDVPSPVPILFDTDPATVDDANTVHVTLEGPGLELINVAPGWVKIRVASVDAEDRRDHNAWRAMSSEATMAGRWYTTWETGTQYYHSPIGLPTGLAVATPIFPGSGGTVLAIAFQVTAVTVTGKHTRVALYQSIDADTPSPGDVLFESGDIDVSSVGLKEVNCSVELRRDTLYFLVLVSDATQTEVIYEGVDTTFMFPTWGRDANDLTLFAGAKLQTAYAYGALVDQVAEWPPADGPGAYNLTTPVVAVRFTGPLAHGRAAGGLQLGGAADVAWQISFDATGGLSFGGEASVSVVVEEDATGGLSFGGDAEAFNTLLEDATGGLALGGAADVFDVTLIDALGGLSFGGDAEVAALQFADATGGLSFGGDAEVEVVVSVDATGGLEFGGNPSIYSTWTEDATGGLSLGGAADYDYDPGVLMQLLLPSTIGSSGWTNPDNMKTDDGSNGTWGPMSMMFSHTGNTDYTNFGFTIPGTVDGVEVIVKQAEDGAAIKLDFVNLINLGSTFGDNKGTSTELSTSMGETTFGGPADMWGAVGILTAATVNGSAFGVRLNWAWISGTPTVSVDWVKIKVYYH